MPFIDASALKCSNCGESIQLRGEVGSMTIWVNPCLCIQDNDLPSLDDPVFNNISWIKGGESIIESDLIKQEIKSSTTKFKDLINFFTGQESK